MSLPDASLEEPERDFPDIDLFEANRRKLLPQLEPLIGQWVAFSPDGSRIVASAADLKSLEKEITKVGGKMSARSNVGTYS